LLDGEILEVENPDVPAGPPFFKFTVYKAEEKSKHCKKLEFDACKTKME